MNHKLDKNTQNAWYGASKHEIYYLTKQQLAIGLVGELYMGIGF